MKKYLILIFLIIFLVGCYSKSGKEIAGNAVDELSTGDDLKEETLAEENIPKINFLLIGNQEECESNGGGWLRTPGTVQNEMHYSCHEKLDDAGMNCFDKADCKGQCVPYGVIEGHIAYGKCSEYDVISSCEFIDQGGIKIISGCSV